MIYRITKFLLFRLSAEKAHHITTFLFEFLCRTPIFAALLGKFFRLDDPRLEVVLWGLTFRNPVGLAAGFDKDGRYLSSMAALGFGFIEVGTVTPRPQSGNPKPRLFRLLDDRAIINRMGFNNGGVDALASRLKKYQHQGTIIGGNIGKNKDTPNERAFEDYLICFEKLYYLVDYFVVNLSSPNTPGLRSLQEKKPLRKILSTLTNYRQGKDVKRPILLKVSPDLSKDQLIDVIDIIEELEIEGLITTNTTISRSPLVASNREIERIGNGGLSGAPLYNRATEVLQQVSEISAGRIPIIGVGGIDSATKALQKLDAGAQLIQLYTGLIYEGPFLVKKIKRAILKEQDSH